MPDPTEAVTVQTSAGGTELVIVRMRRGIRAHCHYIDRNRDRRAKSSVPLSVAITFNIAILGRAEKSN